MKSITQITRITLCASLLTASTLMAETPAVPASAAPSPPAAASPAPAPLTLAEIDPAVRRYLLNTVANTLDASAAYLTEAASKGGQLAEPKPQDILPIVIQILNATPTTDLPAEYQSFMNGVLRIAQQINADFAALDTDATDEEYEQAINKYEPAVMELITQNPKAAALGMRLPESGTALLGELGLTQEQFTALGMTIMLTAQNPSLAPQLATQLSQLAEIIRSKQ